MNFSGYVGHVTVCSWMLTIACCLVVWLGLGLDLVSGWLVVMHTYLYYFPLSLSISRFWRAVNISSPSHRPSLIVAFHFQGSTTEQLCSRMVVSFDPWSVSECRLRACGVRWLGAATSDGRSVSGSQAPSQTAYHGTLLSLTTVLKHTRQLWNHYSDALPYRTS